MAAKALPKALHNAPATALQDAAVPTPAKQAMGDVGQAGTKDALARLNEAMKELRALAAAPLLKRSIEALNRENFVAGGKWALEALEQDERNGVAWYLLAISRERAGDFANSVKAYEAALQLLPDHAEVANDLGRLAYRMGMTAQAEKLFRHYVDHAPHDVNGINNLASAIKDLDRRDEAIEILKQALMLHPDSAILWNTLGTAMIEVGDLENAEIFFAEAARLAPKFSKARYNLSQVKLHLGDPAGALQDCNAALKRVGSADDREMMRLARSHYQLALGHVKQGWEDYEARLSPQFNDVTLFAIDRPRWKPGDDLAGKTLLVVGEQGLGDEVLFANVLPDIVEKLGPNGRLQVVVERRLVSLFQRSFPDAEISSHKTYVHQTRPLRVMPDVDQDTVDLWTPIASLLREFRPTVDHFPARDRYLTADPARVAHWKSVLATAPPGPKVGLLWKSLISKAARERYFSPFEQWKPVLRTPGVSFVNLQYGDCAEEIAQAERELGVTIWQPPGIDLKLDLDDVTALSCAMDLTIGFSNATLNLGAAAGASAWLISTPAVWTGLGLSDRYAWYPQVRVFQPSEPNAWSPLMEDVATALSEFAANAG